MELPNIYKDCSLCEHQRPGKSCYRDECVNESEFTPTKLLQQIMERMYSEGRISALKEVLYKHICPENCLGTNYPPEPTEDLHDNITTDCLL
jgi:hypothetical protein